MKLSHFISTAALAVFFGTAGTLASRAVDTVVTRYSDELEAESAAESKRLVPKSDHVVELDKHKYLELLKSHDEVFIEFYANWCAACHGLAPEFNAFAESARKKYPNVAIARADISKIEYLSSSYLVNMLPELVFIRRPAPGVTPEVRFVTANFTDGELLDYIGGGWVEDKPVGGYSSLWCTPTNMCGHIGGLLGELVIEVDKKFNRFDIPPWAFMAIIVSVVYMVGQILVGYLARAFRKKYHESINKTNSDSIKPVYFNEYRSDLGTDKSGAGVPSTPTKGSPKSAKQGSAAKRPKGKRSKKD